MQGISGHARNKLADHILGKAGVGDGVPCPFSSVIPWPLLKSDRWVWNNLIRDLTVAWFYPHVRRDERMPLTWPRQRCRGWPPQDSRLPLPWPGWCWAGLWSASVKACCCSACSISSSWWSCTSMCTRSASTSSVALTMAATDPGAMLVGQGADIIITITTSPGPMPH